MYLNKYSKFDLNKVLVSVFLILFSVFSWANPLPQAKPEEVGMSSERLKKVKTYFDGEVAAGR